MQAIVIVNKSSGVAFAELQRWVEAIQRQLVNDVLPAWGTCATLHVQAPGEKIDRSAWVLELVDRASADGSLGSHWLSGDTPRGDVGDLTSKDDGVETSAVLSHEILELLVDPFALDAYQVGGDWWIKELCDPVEGSDDSYRIDGVLVENFVLPAYFREGSAGPWDCRGKLQRPLQVLERGYQIVAKAGGEWQQITGALARKSKQIAGATSRRASRLRRAGIEPLSIRVVSA